MYPDVGRESKMRAPGGRPGTLQVVEAAGQLIHVFRHGLDYAFIP